VEVKAKVENSLSKETVDPDEIPHISLAAEAVDVLRTEAILKAVDDVLVSDVGNGGVYLEEAPGVGPQGLVPLLLDL
jgi:hypothetical protein